MEFSFLILDSFAAGVLKDKVEQRRNVFNIVNLSDISKNGGTDAYHLDGELQIAEFGLSLQNSCAAVRAKRHSKNFRIATKIPLQPGSHSHARYCSNAGFDSSSFFCIFIKSFGKFWQWIRLNPNRQRFGDIDPATVFFGWEYLGFSYSLWPHWWLRWLLFKSRRTATYPLPSL